MAPPKDIQNVRTVGPHRLSVGSPANASAVRPSSSRPHAHSVSMGSLNPVHRVNRRKSSSSMAGVNVAALQSTLASGKAAAASSSALSRSPYPAAGTFAPPPPPPPPPAVSADNNDDKNNNSISAANVNMSSNHDTSSAIVDGPPLSVVDRSSAKARSRRASEGSRLSKSERRRSTAGELKCETCGKGYKHGSCLTKHLWEHTPEWNLTSKLLISKHQQVQLLEAASVLVQMNNDGPPGSESAVQNDSDMSDSPAASGSSDLREDDLSSRTSTPSQHGDETEPRQIKRPTRQDSYSTAYSRSYQSTSGNSFAASSAPNEGYEYATHHYWPLHNPRPSTSSSNMAHAAYNFEDQTPDVAAAAAGLLSCSLGTPKQGPLYLPPDVPPVPPLPAKFARQNDAPAHHLQYPARVPQPHDIQMLESSRGYSHVRGLSDEDDEGVFGRMDQ